MNERMMRWAPKAVAEFVTAFSEGKGQLGDATWLVWAYEGDYTLADLMQVGGWQSAEDSVHSRGQGAGRSTVQPASVTMGRSAELCTLVRAYKPAWNAPE